MRATSLISAEASAMPTTHATSLTNGEIVEENDLGSIRRVTAGGVTFQSLHECRDRQGGWVLHGQVSVVGVAVELDHSVSSSAHVARLVFSAKVGISSVNTGRRCLVTNTRWACNVDALCRALR